MSSFFICSSIQVYSGAMCQYRNESFLNINGTVQRTVTINDSYCEENVCKIEFTNIVVDTADDLVVSVVAGNRFEETAATPSDIQCM